VRSGSDVGPPQAPRRGLSRPSRNRAARTGAAAGPAVLTAIVHMLTNGCAWRDLPPLFGVPVQTAQRRFAQWTRARSLAEDPPEQEKLGPMPWTRASRPPVI